MDGAPVVRAQIKLAFHTADQRSILAIRSFQLTQKKGGKREFKATESIIKTTNSAKEVTSISNKCAEIGKLVPQLMEVSAPVLENVIFCHQEDSNCKLSLHTRTVMRYAHTAHTQLIR